MATAAVRARAFGSQGAQACDAEAAADADREPLVVAEGGAVGGLPAPSERAACRAACGGRRWRPVGLVAGGLAAAVAGAAFAVQERTHLARRVALGDAVAQLVRLQALFGASPAARDGPSRQGLQMFSDSEDPFNGIITAPSPAVEAMSQAAPAGGGSALAAAGSPLVAPSPGGAALAADGCAVFGCGSFHEQNSCQCNAACEDFQSCCADYPSVCKPADPTPSPSPAVPAAPLARAGGGGGHAAAAGHGLCSNYGCGGFGRKQSCQCNDNCKDYGNCCSDYTDTCLDTDSPPPPTAPSATEGGGAQRGGKHSGWEAAGSSGDAGGDSLGCADYGCGEYNADQKCQCNPDCKTFDSCCSDYEVFCGGASVGPPQQAEDPAGFMGGAGGAGGDSCAKFGCVTYNAGHSCQCNAGCTEFGSCCSDYEEHCTAADGGHRSESASSDSGDGFFAAGGPPLSQAAEQTASAPGAGGGGSCLSYGCVDFDATHACQCNEGCREHGSCCPDYGEACTAGGGAAGGGAAGGGAAGGGAAGGGGPPPAAPPAAAAALSPQDDLPWECWNYLEGQDGEWCKRAGTQEGFTYGFFDQPPEGPCGSCWCCRRPAPLVQAAPPPPSGLAPDGLAFR